MLSIGSPQLPGRQRTGALQKLTDFRAVPVWLRPLQIGLFGVELFPRMLPTDVMNDYPGQPRERDRWILARRGARNQLDPFKPRAFFVEEERAESGEVVSVATIFLTNRECPWRCLMCDLWKNTLTETAPVGAVPARSAGNPARRLCRDCRTNPCI